MFLASENIDFTGLSHVFLLGGGEGCGYFSVAILYQALRKGTYLKVLRHGGVDNVRAFLKG